MRRTALAGALLAALAQIGGCGGKSVSYQTAGASGLEGALGAMGGHANVADAPGGRAASGTGGGGRATGGSGGEVSVNGGAAGEARLSVPLLSGRRHSLHAERYGDASEQLVYPPRIDLDAPRTWRHGSGTSLNATA